MKNFESGLKGPKPVELTPAETPEFHFEPVELEARREVGKAMGKSPEQIEAEIREEERKATDRLVADAFSKKIEESQK